MKIIISSYKL